LRAVADFINSISGGWWFRVPVLFKTGGDCNCSSDKHLPCFWSPLGLSTENLVEGLYVWIFLTLSEVQVSEEAWDNFSHHAFKQTGNHLLPS
jgi:hypothetical protein